MPRRQSLVALSCLFLPTVLLAADPPWIARSRLGMVASDSPEASQIGADVLVAGGNAFDAAIATSCALAVARPHSTGLGGGGFMVAYVADKSEFVTLDFREVAPAAATAEVYARLHAARSDGPSPSVYGGHAVGVPGQLAGLAEIHKRFASRPLGDLVRPAIALARAGFVADEHYRDACASAIDDYRQWPELGQRHRRLYETLLRGGTAPAIGDRVQRPDLARALELVAERGADAFYTGPLGEAAVRAVQAVGGPLALADLASYRVRERTPIRVRYGQYEIIAMPPPSSGGICIAESLNVLSALAERRACPPPLVPHAEYPLLLLDALRHSFADRARWLGDPDFASVPAARLIDPAYAHELAARTITNLDDFGSMQLPEDRGTSHFCVADRHGNVVALTETINGTFGSLVVAEPFGIILNNQMDDFAANPGQPNLFGLIQGEANAVAPGKHPLSSMSPTLVFKDGKPVLTLGGSGGPRIITSVLQVMLNVIDADRPLDEAMQAIRLHHQWRPDEVCFDQAPPSDLVEKLKAAGVTISERRKTGVVQAIQFLEDGTMVGASDPRKGGRPAGVKAELRPPVR